MSEFQNRVADYTDALRGAFDTLGARLQARQFEAAVDLLRRERSEVLLGFASRLWRLAKYIVVNPMLWDESRSASEMRAVVDSVIVAEWLVGQGDERFSAFVAYGRGQLKLLKLHAEDFADQFEDRIDPGYLEALSERVNEDVIEEFQSINVGGAFPGVTIRKMADEAGLKALYDLRYQPLSAAVHGQWDSLVASDLRRTSDPLYDGHRFGTFSTSDEEIDSTVPLEAMSLSLAAIAAIFSDLGVDVQGEVRDCWDIASASHDAFVGRDE